MLQLDRAEAEALRSQFATSNDGRGGRRYAPYVFTEQGVAMLSGVPRGSNTVRSRRLSKAEVAHAALVPAEVVGDLVADGALDLGSQQLGVVAEVAL